MVLFWDNAATRGKNQAWLDAHRLAVYEGESQGGKRKAKEESVPYKTMLGQPAAGAKQNAMGFALGDVVSKKR